MELCISCGKENEDASRYCCCYGMEIQDEELQNSIAQQTSLGEKPVTVQSLESVILPDRMENIGQRAFLDAMI